MKELHDGTVRCNENHFCFNSSSFLFSDALYWTIFKHCKDWIIFWMLKVSEIGKQNVELGLGCITNHKLDLFCFGLFFLWLSFLSDI